MKYLKLFNQTSEYEVFKESEEYVLPNVSYIWEFKDLPAGDPRKIHFAPKPKPIVLKATYNAVDDGNNGMHCYYNNDGNIKSIKIDGNTVQFDPEVTHNSNFEINTTNMVIDWDELTATCPDEYLIYGKIKSWTIKPKDRSIVLTQEAFDNGDILFGNVYKEDDDDTKYFYCYNIYTDEEWDFDVASNSLSLNKTAIDDDWYSYYNCNFVLLKYNYDTEQPEMIDTVIEVEYITGGVALYYMFETEGYHEVEFTLKENYIGNCMFQYCSSLTDIIIPNSVTSIGDSAFEYCTSLTPITIPNSVTSIGKQAFSSCSSLTSIVIPDSVTSIENNTFNGCSNLTSVTIPDSVTSIGNYAFYNCSSLTSITCLATTAPIIQSNTFQGVKQYGSLHYPEGSDYSSWLSTSSYYLGYYKWNIDITSCYLTIEALEDGLTASLSTNACEYCVDGDGNWKTLSAGTATESINNGQTLSFRGNITPTSSGIGTFTISKKCNLKGNCMSMLFKDNAADNYSLSGKTWAFDHLFDNCTNIVNVSENFLPATTLSTYCYSYMFYGCTSLITAPNLPATTLSTYCYNGMFSGCTKLTTAPELPATTLANTCYDSMFQGCTSLTTAPKLPATTLADYCYKYMFQGCTSLTTAPKLPATTLADYCYQYMFAECTGLITAPELPATTLAQSCYYSMFQTCTSLTTASELPATTLEKSCYASMFYGCTSLTTAPELPATTLAQSCYASMFSGCTKLNYIKMLATDTSGKNCLYNWVKNVASTGTFEKHPNITTLPTGASGIPSGWTVVDAA